jgi:hypothetical protein
MALLNKNPKDESLAELKLKLPQVKFKSLQYNILSLIDY